MSLFFYGGAQSPPPLRRVPEVRPAGEVRVLRLPGVYRPQEDTHLLLDTVLGGGLPPGARVLELCTGTGRVALGLAAAGAGDVTAVDLSRRAVLTARLNARLNRLGVRVRRADLFDEGLAERLGARFDVVVANPPYVPAPEEGPPRGAARAWDAGPGGRALLDRICLRAPELLAPGGTLWVVQSALSAPGRTEQLLAAHGLAPEVAARATIPFGPVLRARAEWLRAQGLLTEGQDTEDLVVIRARRR